MIEHCHKKLFSNNSPFALMAVVALIIGIGDILCALGDLVWLIGDMKVGLHFHHYIVMAFLIPANLLISGSFFWLYLAINKFLSKSERKEMRSDLTKTLKLKVLPDVIDDTELDLQYNARSIF